MIERLRRLPEATRALRMARRLEAHERWDVERLREHQRERLLAIVRHAAAGSPYYRERFAGIELSDDLDLAALPKLDKATMLEHFDELVTDRRLSLAGIDRHLAEMEDVDPGIDPKLFGEYRAVASGGSSGRRGVFVYGPTDFREVLAGLMRCYGAYCDFAPRLPRRRLATIIADHPVYMGGRYGRSLDIGAHRMLRLDARAPIAELVEALNAFRPQGIATYPSTAALLAERQLAGELRIAPRMVATSGEVRTTEIEERIAAAWGRVSFDWYGASEAPFIAAECDRHAGMHVFEDLVWLEVLDDEHRPVSAGRPGSRLLVTNLFNRTQPLIRYELNDLLTVSPDPCPCGRPFPLLESVGGRSDDVLELPAAGGGTIKVPPLTLCGALGKVLALSEYRIVYGSRALKVEVVVQSAADGGQVRDEIKARLDTTLTELGVQAPPIRVESVDEIPRHPHSGKHKAVESRPRRRAGDSPRRPPRVPN